MHRMASLLFAAVVGLALVGCGTFSGTEEDGSNLKGKDMTVYYSPSCTCCKHYIDYLEKQGVDVTAKRRNRSRMQQVKGRLGVSRSAASCHTGVIGDYVVEGHVPVESISRLLDEKPQDVAGVTIPGMPQHAPGMRGPIGTNLTVFSLDQSGRATETFDTVRY